MANNLTREETNEILLKVYSDNLEDTEKTKKISNIPKLLDKFDGKYDKLVEALYKKYPNVSKDDDSFNDYEPVEKRSPKKETPIFPDVMEESEELDEPEEPDVMEESEEELSRSRVSVLMEESYRQNLEDPDKKIAGIPKMLDKFEGRYEKLMEAMSKKYPLRDYSSEKNTQKSFEELVNSIRNNYQNRESWADLSKYFDSVGKLGRSLECSNHSKNL